MKLLEQVTEPAMVAAFLKAEYQSERFSDDLKLSMQKLGVKDTIITQPDLTDEHENRLRTQLLGDYRGYKQNKKIFKGFPDNLTWYRAEITRNEIGNLRYVDYSYWNELTDNTHLVKSAVKNIEAGKIVFNVSNDRFLAVAEKIRQGEHDFEPMILWGENEYSPLTILEGHLRATAFGLAGSKSPEIIEVIVGLKQTTALSGLVLLIGAPGAGKSTFARKLIRRYGLDREAYISNDLIAKDLFGVAIDRGDKDGAIFAEQDRRIAERLADSRTTIVDATNVKPEARQRIIEIAKKYDQPITAFVFRRDLATLLKQNNAREVKVPEGMVREYAALMESVSDDGLQNEGIDIVIEV